MDQSCTMIVRQSGVVPFRTIRGHPQVMLITNRGGDRWLVPKGHIEAKMTPAQSAAKEAYEEAGIRGVLHPTPLGTFEYVRRGVHKVVELFPLMVTEAACSWLEMAHRRRRWVTMGEAVALVSHPGLARCIATLESRLDLGVAA